MQTFGAIGLFHPLSALGGGLGGAIFIFIVAKILRR